MIMLCHIEGRIGPLTNIYTYMHMQRMFMVQFMSPCQRPATLPRCVLPMVGSFGLMGLAYVSLRRNWGSKETSRDFAKFHYVADDGVIGKTITARTPCAKKHYGMCITRDVLFFRIALWAANALMALFLKGGACERIAPGSYFKLEATGAEKKHLFLVFAGIRAGVDKFCLFTEAEYEEDECHVPGLCIRSCGNRLVPSTC